MLKVKSNILNLVHAMLATLMVAGFFALPPAASAAPSGGSGPNGSCLPRDVNCTPAGSNSTGGTNNNGSTNLGEDCNKDQNNLKNCLKDNRLVVRLREVINFLSAGVGVLAVMMIIVGGIQYSAAGDNPAALQAAKKRIFNVVYGLIVFVFIWAFLQWLIPGGIFNI